MKAFLMFLPLMVIVTICSLTIAMIVKKHPIKLDPKTEEWLMDRVFKAMGANEIVCGIVAVILSILCLTKGFVVTETEQYIWKTLWDLSFAVFWGDITIMIFSIIPSSLASQSQKMREKDSQ